jgi:demethylmenaquinone methyltransferase/2-methoxy-6-polyprenyl-1,4-benzoquinol methylase
MLRWFFFWYCICSMISKKERWVMFDSISATYDTVNRFITFGTDVVWRTNLLSLISPSATDMLDVASGTMDVAIGAAKKFPQLNIIALDMAKDMLSIGELKCRNASIISIQPMIADVHHIPLNTNAMDVVTVAFGIRNFEHLKTAFSEMYRVLKPGGQLLILESCQPKNTWLRCLNALYLKAWVVPIGGVLSGKKNAYRYLLNSIASFHSPEALTTMLKTAGFSCVEVSFLMAQSVQLIHAIK